MNFFNISVYKMCIFLYLFSAHLSYHHRTFMSTITIINTALNIIYTPHYLRSRLSLTQKSGGSCRRSLSPVDFTLHRFYMVLSFYKLLDLSLAFTTQSITACLKPPSSRASHPSMVVPAGEVTMSFSWPGCMPVSRIIFADPSTV